MRIFRVVYQEIDTQDKNNPITNRQIEYQKSLSEYDIQALGSSYSKYIEYVKQDILKQLQQAI